MENTLNEEDVTLLKNDDKENSEQQKFEHNGENDLKNEIKIVKENQADDEALKKVEIKIQDVERKTKENISKIEMLLKSGLLNQMQGESLIQQIIKKGYIELQQCGLEQSDKEVSKQIEQKPFDKNNAIIEFEKEYPDFFKENSRLGVLNYLKSGDLQFDKEELIHISEMIKDVENSAIERYLKKTELEEKMIKTNEEAKFRLNANAQNAKESSFKQTVFTREQIGKMSGAEFTKNEKLIMEQLKKGLIR